jgi:hypothetical protein
MTSSDYGGFVAFDVLIESNVRVYVVTSLGAFRRLILDHTTLPVDRHTYYFSKSGVGGAGTYLMVVEIDNNPYTSVFVVQ